MQNGLVVTRGACNKAHVAAKRLFDARALRRELRTACEAEYRTAFGHAWEARPFDLDLAAARAEHQADFEASTAIADLKDAAQHVLKLVQRARALEVPGAPWPNAPPHYRMLASLVDEQGDALEEFRVLGRRRIDPTFQPLGYLLGQLGRPHPQPFWNRGPGRPGSHRLPYGDPKRLSNREVAVIYALADRGRGVALAHGMTVADAIGAYRRAVRQARKRRK